MSGLNTLSGSVPQLHQQYRNHLPQQLQTGQNSTAPGANQPNPQTANSESSPAESQDGAKADKNTDPELDDDKLSKRERKNRPGQKFGAKKKSWVWTWFVQDSRDPNVAVCDYCGKIITRQPSDKGSPKKLSEHLKTHKLSRDSINTSRSVPVDGNGITYSPSGLSMPNYKNYQNQNQNNQGSGSSNQNMSNPQLGSMLQHSLQNQSLENDDMPQPKPTKYRRTGPMNGVQGVGSVPTSNSQGSSRINSISGVNVDERLMNNSHQGQNHTQNQSQLARNTASGSPVQYGRRYISPNFDNAPYSAGKFHKHLLHFLADNKLSIRLLKSHSFQQLIYDLRPDSITDLLELTGLYSSFVEVSRVDTDPEAQEGHQTSLAETNVVNTLAQNLPRGD
ncbi:uncharacterized protein CXQ87_002061 [Candidozyma duobushaemuli]|nr:uncharacterized protein CXQ87_002061 [[Candida] duobushaemulonis]PVH13942.1 hypothetical protein CXQ87_002061 [[Candida] duobushaemulonis]